MDPNKERREAVKRKTTQYLKRAEEIFITHLQDNLGKGSSHLGVRQSVIPLQRKLHLLVFYLLWGMSSVHMRLPLVESAFLACILWVGRQEGTSSIVSYIRWKMFSAFLSHTRTFLSQTPWEKHAVSCFVLHCSVADVSPGFHHQGYSSLRFRPIRHLSSPVEDLEMCKVVGVTDKVGL